MYFSIFQKTLVSLYSYCLGSIRGKWLNRFHGNSRFNDFWPLLIKKRCFLEREVISDPLHFYTNTHIRFLLRIALKIRLTSKLTLRSVLCIARNVVSCEHNLKSDVGFLMTFSHWRCQHINTNQNSQVTNYSSIISINGLYLIAMSIIIIDINGCSRVHSYL